jgi:malonate decarboxylase beta subunit
VSVPGAYVSFAEATPRERLAAILDRGTFRELLDPFARATSPYLALQGLVAQSDDGVVVGRGNVAGAAVSAVAIDGRFLGGSIGEVGGAKIAAVLERAPAGAVIAFDTGGIRLQEANLGILAIAEICDAIVALRARAPVIAVIAGRIGCYGGMSIAAALCSTIVMSAGARLGLNGPDVVEQEAGIGELDARDRPLIWRLTGGARRVAQGHADRLVSDDCAALAKAVRTAFEETRNAQRTATRRLRPVFAESGQMR